ncbi:MAG: AAA family ATPase, partial [Planctomycetota bacterium]|nr:AAA family ATPase [Planctomycetota bacterium]
MVVRKMPIGVQDFAKLRENNCAYADKTGFVYELASGVAPYFLGRPRRFGKSLLISTIKYYFLGRRDLFTGLKIADLETEWAEYPVFHIDLNIGNYTGVQDLADNLSTIISRLETLWGKGEDENTLPARFEGIIRRAAEKSGRKVVVLVDEYDRPLIHTMENNLAQDDIRNM